MITKFNLFKEAVDFNDTKNILDLNLDNAQKVDPNKKDPEQIKNANLKIMDVQKRILQLNEQKKLINNEIIKLQSAQRDLVPNNPNDPKNAENVKNFLTNQQEQINIQTQKLNAFDAEILNLQKQVEILKKQYL